jgi:hypothetical protein
MNTGWKNASHLALAQVQEDLLEKRSATERENLALQAKWDEERAQLQQRKEQFLT